MLKMLASRKVASPCWRGVSPRIPSDVLGSHCNTCHGIKAAIFDRRCSTPEPSLPGVSPRFPTERFRRLICFAAAVRSNVNSRREEPTGETQRGKGRRLQENGAQTVAALQAGGEGTAEEQAALPAETDAVLVAGQQAQLLVSEEEEVVMEQIVEPLTFQSAVARSQSFLTTTLPGKLLLGGVVASFLGSLLLATYRVWQKANTAQARRMRQIDRNRELVEGLNSYLLASNRAAFTPGAAQKLQRASGFSPVEMFRKYLWYLLRERKFDLGAVEDLVAIKVGLALTDADVAEALRERATRIYDKYGTLMLNTEGLTLTGAQSKATCTALFRKVLYLAECERMVGAVANEPGGSGVGSAVDIGKIFGATIEDMDRLRIKNLYEAELDLEGMMVDSTDEDGPGSAASISGNITAPTPGGPLGSA